MRKPGPIADTFRVADAQLFGLTRNRVVTFIALGLAAAFFEGFGMAMFLPVLQFVEKGQDVAHLAAASDTWRKLLHVYAWAHVPVTLMTLLSMAIASMLIRVGFTYSRQVYTAWLSQEIQHTTRSNLFDAYMGMSYAEFSRFSSGGLLNILLDESRRVAGGFGALFSVISNVAVVIGFIVVLLWLSTPMTLLAVAFLGATAVLVAYYTRHIRASSHSATDANDLYVRIALERLDAFRLSKLTGLATREAARTRAASAAARDYLYHLAKMLASVDLIMEPMVVICGGAILYLAVGSFGMSLSEVGLFMLILLRLLPVVKEVVKSWQSYVACTGSFAAVRDSYATSLSAQEGQGGDRDFAPIGKSIRFDTVSFSYPGVQVPALRGISLEIPAGKTTALVGPSGSGKTTLVDLIPRLRDLTQGRLLFDEMDVADFNLVSLRREIGFVSQDAVILDDTLASNLRFVAPKATDQELWDALEIAQAAEFVRNLPEGIETQVGAKGTRLSGGQKQRLSLARTLLQKTSILVLDEPTSALDYETERGIQVALDAIRAQGGVTVIIIAHRLSTIRNADQIIVMKDGQVVERGTHDELRNGDEWYSQAASIQVGER